MKNKPNWTFQKPLIEKCYKALFNFKEVVLSSAPASGKTTMALKIAKKYLRESPDSSVLILAHGQIIIREQWKERFASAKLGKFSHYTVEKKYEPSYLKEHQIIISLPQTLKKLPRGFRADLLIVDEAHQRYDAEQVQSIIKKVKPKHRLLLTATPALFIDNKEHQDTKVIGITIQELLPYNIVVDTRVEIVEAAYDFLPSAYLSSGELKTNTRFGVIATNKVLDEITHRIMGRFCSTKRLSSWELKRKHWKKNINSLNKTMFICASQKQAQDVYQYLAKAGIGHNIELSTCDACSGIEEIERFKDDPLCKILIVVNRGILGFNYPDMTNLVDLSCSLNINGNYQKVGRLLRPSHNPKLYIKVINEKLHEYTTHIMNYVMLMSSSRYFYSNAPLYIQLRGGGRSPTAEEALNRKFPIPLKFDPEEVLKTFGMDALIKKFENIMPKKLLKNFKQITKAEKEKIVKQWAKKNKIIRRTLSGTGNLKEVKDISEVWTFKEISMLDMDNNDILRTTNFTNFSEVRDKTNEYYSNKALYEIVINEHEKTRQQRSL